MTIGSTEGWRQGLAFFQIYDTLLDAILAHLILINRPLVVSPLGVKPCRPSETVLDLLPSRQLGAFAKEDGEQGVDASGERSA